MTTLPADWPYHGRSSGYRYGCRCDKCKDFHRREQAQTNHRAVHGDHRTCKRCANDYDRRQDPDAGTKYCGDCRRQNVAYPVAVPKSAARATTCPLCGQSHKRNNRWHVCHECEQELPEHIWRSLKTHHASLNWVKQAMTSPTCQICETDLRQMRRTANGKWKSSFCIDHSHNCCTKQTSCGNCIRGFLCHACNAGIGYLKDDAETIAKALTYVKAAT